MFRDLFFELIVLILNGDWDVLCMLCVIDLIFCKIVFIVVKYLIIGEFKLIKICF